MEQNNSALIPLGDILKMGEIAAKSGFLGVRNADEAITLMLVAQSENRHPMTVAKEYHVIKGKPSLKADAMLARFQQAGGKVEWKELTDQRVCAVFTHPQAGSIEIDWDMKRAENAELPKYNPNWFKYPRAMLRSRVISEGIRTAFPSVLLGFYSPEEVEDIIAEATARKNVVQNAEPAKPSGAVEVAAEVVSPSPEPAPAPVEESASEKPTDEELEEGKREIERAAEAGVPYPEIRAKAVAKWSERPPLLIRATLAALAAREKDKRLSEREAEETAEANKEVANGRFE